MSGISGCSFSCLSWRSRLKWEYRGSESYKCGGILEGLDDHGVAQSQSVRRATSARLTVSPMQRLQRAGCGSRACRRIRAQDTEIPCRALLPSGPLEPRWLMEQALTAIIQEAWISSVPRRWVEELAQANPLRSCVLHHTIAL
jgi:hypothetical protein